jgi:hypothetical protein
MPMGSNQSVQRYEMNTSSNGRQPPMEEDLKLRKVENLSIKMNYNGG